MSRKMKFAAWFFALALLTVWRAPGYACDCVTPKPPCEAYEQAEAVFVGEVTLGKRAVSEGYGWLVTLAVTEAFRGVTGNTVEITTGMGGGDCGYDFQRGGRYLIYARRAKQSGRLATSICSRTRKLDEADNDLAYLRTRGQAKAGAALFGQVSVFPRKYRAGQPHSTPLAQTRVTITGAQRRFTATTDAKGNFRLEGLAAGKYQVSVEPPAGVLAREPMELTLNDKGCGEANFWLQAK